jgi:hypothetical protein
MSLQFCRRSYLVPFASLAFVLPFSVGHWGIGPAIAAVEYMGSDCLESSNCANCNYGRKKQDCEDAEFICTAYHGSSTASIGKSCVNAVSATHHCMGSAVDEPTVSCVYDVYNCGCGETYPDSEDVCFVPDCLCEGDQMESDVEYWANMDCAT